MASVRLENLSKNFGGLMAVNGLSLEVAHGEFIALLGPSGCGKTTTMNMIAGMEIPSRGEIYFDDRAMRNVPPGKRNVGFVFQNYAIFTHMTVYGNLSFGLRARKLGHSKEEIDREVKSIAEVVGVTDILSRKAGRLSVNDMQKVALGRSMIVKPAIFLLDEPFSNLDAAFRAYMRAELKHIQHDIGQTMIYVTHDQVEAMSMADRIAVMNRGVLQQFGTPLEIYDHPANTFVAKFVGSTPINLLPAEVMPEELPGRNPSDSGHTVAIRPEHVRLLPNGSGEATRRATITLIEPLGPKDLVHLVWNGHDVRAVGRPGRHGIGDEVGVAFDPARVLWFDETGEAAV